MHNKFRISYYVGRDPSVIAQIHAGTMHETQIDTKTGNTRDVSSHVNLTFSLGHRLMNR
jgi:hypothetical protein